MQLAPVSQPGPAVYTPTAVHLSSVDRVFEPHADDFIIYHWKVHPCPKTFAHDWSCCPGFHANERTRRRSPGVFTYASSVCPDWKESNSCPRGDACSLSHGIMEFWLHPQRYHTQMCRMGASCTRRICFFAHNQQQLRRLQDPLSAKNSSSMQHTSTNSTGPAAMAPLAGNAAATDEQSAAAAGQAVKSGPVTVAQGDDASTASQPALVLEAPPALSLSLPDTPQAALQASTHAASSTASGSTPYAQAPAAAAAPGSTSGHTQHAVTPTGSTSSAADTPTASSEAHPYSSSSQHPYKARTQRQHYQGQHHNRQQHGRRSTGPAGRTAARLGNPSVLNPAMAQSMFAGLGAAPINPDPAAMLAVIQHLQALGMSAAVPGPPVYPVMIPAGGGFPAQQLLHAALPQQPPGFAMQLSAQQLPMQQGFTAGTGSLFDLGSSSASFLPQQQAFSASSVPGLSFAGQLPPSGLMFSQVPAAAGQQAFAAQPGNGLPGQHVFSQAPPFLQVVQAPQFNPQQQQQQMQQPFGAPQQTQQLVLLPVEQGGQPWAVGSQCVPGVAVSLPPSSAGMSVQGDGFVAPQ